VTLNYCQRDINSFILKNSSNPAKKAKRQRYFNGKIIQIPFAIQEKWFIMSVFISNPEAGKDFILITPETDIIVLLEIIVDFFS